MYWLFRAWPCSYLTSFEINPVPSWTIATSSPFQILTSLLESNLRSSYGSSAKSWWIRNSGHSIINSDLIDFASWLLLLKCSANQYSILDYEYLVSYETLSTSENVGIRVRGHHLRNGWREFPFLQQLARWASLQHFYCRSLITMAESLYSILVWNLCACKNPPGMVPKSSTCTWSLF